MAALNSNAILLLAVETDDKEWTCPTNEWETEFYHDIPVRKSAFCPRGNKRGICLISCDLPRAIRLAMIRGCFSRCLRDFRPDLFSQPDASCIFIVSPGLIRLVPCPGVWFIAEIKYRLSVIFIAPSPSIRTIKISTKKYPRCPFYFDFWSVRYLFSVCFSFCSIPIDLMKLCYRLPYVHFITRKKGNKKENIPLEILFNCNVYCLHVQ